MTHFEYIAVLVSLVLAIGLSHVMAAIAELLQRREAVKFDWLHAGATGLLVLLLTQFWWGFWNYRLVEDWTYLTVLIVLTPVATIVTAGLILVPRIGAGSPNERLDLGEHYLDHRAGIYGMAALTFVFFGIADVSINEHPLIHAENAIRGLAIGLCVAAARIRDRRLHTRMIGIAYVLIAVFLFVAIER
ncbi:MAG: hypothetical protein NXI30_01050 [bacterium]|nr:hypothetical protein [bacterium]